MRTGFLIGVCALVLSGTSSDVEAQVNTTVETLRVPSNGSAAQAKTRIKPRKIYYIIADGRYFDDVEFGILSDAEFDDISLVNPLDRCGGGLDDAGIGINSLPVVYGGQGKINRWSSTFNSSNRYEVVWVLGKEDPAKLSFRVHDCNYDDNQDDFSDPLRIEIQAPQSGDCTVDVAYQEPPEFGVNKDVSIALEGHLFDHNERRAHWCNNSLFNVYAFSGPGLEKPLAVEAPEGVSCTSASNVIYCHGILRGKTVKLTFGTLDSRNQFQKKWSYTIVPVDPYH